MTVRRKPQQCPAVHGGGSLTRPVEWILTSGDAFGIIATPRFSELEIQWRRHGEQLTATHRAFFPGSRPWHLYARGGIPLPDEAFVPTTFPTVTCGGHADGVCRGWHLQAAELAHLVKLKIVDAGEAAQARKRLKHRGGSYAGYPWISPF